MRSLNYLASTDVPDPKTLPEQIRWWRRRRRLSQLELAGRAGLSQRHLSFIELGRARPSREMLLRIAEALSVPLRRQNVLLRAAGFAPQWRETRPGEAAPEDVARALEHMLGQQEPFPAVAVDRRWNLLDANRSAVDLVAFLVGPVAPGTAINLADALVAPDVLRPFLTNWPEIVRHFIASVEADAWEDGSPETAALLERLRRYHGVGAALRAAAEPGAGGPILPMIFAKDGITLRLFTTIATLGTPRDVDLAELRIENFYPMDEATEAWFRARQS